MVLGACAEDKNTTSSTCQFSMQDSQAQPLSAYPVTFHVHCMMFSVLTQQMLPHSDVACCVWLTAQPCYCGSILNWSHEPPHQWCVESNERLRGLKGILTLIRNVLEKHTSS